MSFLSGVKNIGKVANASATIAQPTRAHVFTDPLVKANFTTTASTPTQVCNFAKTLNPIMQQ